jgi:hypothetical protein
MRDALVRKAHLQQVSAGAVLCCSARGWAWAVRVLCCARCVVLGPCGSGLLFHVLR